jgi:undecaprenyl-diphosphatase
MDFFNELIAWDKEFFLFLNGIHSPLWDYTMTLFTLTPTWLVFYGLIVGIIVKKHGKKSLFIFVAIALLILCADQFAGVLKHTIQRLRPSNDPTINQLTHIFFNKGGQYGFVSAHAANTFAFATFSSLLFRNSRYTSFIFPWAAIIAYSRIYLGVHFPGDVLGGAILGILIGITIHRLLKLSELRLSRINMFDRNPLKNKEANQIIITGLFILFMCISVVAQMLRNGLIGQN